MPMSLDESSPLRGAPAHPSTKLYDETLGLLIDARTYLSGKGQRQREALSIGGQLAFARESMRVTSRLVQAMAWLMPRRAVLSGEITAIEGRGPEHRLANYRVCIAGDHGQLEGLPPELCDLWGRSLELFRRIARLEDLARRSLIRRPVPPGQTLRQVAH